MSKKFDELVDIIKILRSPGGCKWDQKQTMFSLIPHIIEESYELIDALEKKDLFLVKEELGDLLLQVIMLSNMAEEENLFSINEVIQLIKEKMIRRHPHVFDDTKINSVEDIWHNWEKIKDKEKKTQKGLFNTIPRKLPALLEAEKVQKKLARIGFDWEHISDPIKKLDEEVEELKSNVENNKSKDLLEDEFGDILFSLVNIARKIDINPEIVLRKSISKFRQRIEKIEETLNKENLSFADISYQEFDDFWQKIKIHE